EVLTGFRQGEALVKRTKQWQFMKMASVWCQMAFRWEKRGSGIGALQNIGWQLSDIRRNPPRFIFFVRRPAATCCPRPSSYSRFSAQLLSDVSDDVLDGPNLVGFIIDGPKIIAFLTVDVWVAALVDDGTQFFRPLAGCFKRPHRTAANSDEALSVVT